MKKNKKSIFISIIVLMSCLFYFVLWGEESHLIEQPEDIDSSHEERQPQQAIQEPEAPQYDVELHFNPETGLLKGSSHISIWNRADQPTDQALIQVFMNAFQNSVDPPVLEAFKEAAYPSGIKHTQMDLHKVEVNNIKTDYELEGTVLQLNLREAWNPDQKLEITLEWGTVIPNIHHRVGSQDDAFWFGNVLPIMAVYDNEWHAYQYKTVGDPFFSEASNYFVTIQTPEGYDVIATGNEFEVVQEGNSKKTKIEALQAREFAFAITQRHKVLTEITQSGIEVHFYYRDTEEETVIKNLKLATEMLDYLEQRVGPYPYEQLSIFENQMFITGMEYPGLVFISSHRLKTPTAHVTVLHEIAHQWFYNLIGNNQVLEPWLDEGFATYFTDEFLLEDQLGAYYATEQKNLDKKSPNLRMQPVQQYGDWSTYWRSNYRKSSFMVFDLRKRMGEEQFQSFISEYYTLYKYEIVTTEGFKRLVGKYIDEDIDVLFEEWGLSSIPR